MIGILGGTFDPIHYGHIRPAQALLAQLPFDEIRFMPSAVPPHRAQPVASSEQRLAMVELATRDIQGFTVERCELERSGPSYMVDSLAQVRAQLGEIEPLVLIMGADAFLGLPGWHQWQSLTEHAHILVTQRPDYAIRPQEMLAGWLAPRRVEAGRLSEQPGGYVAFVSQDLVDISSTRIRERIRLGQDIRGLLPDAVCDYINEKGLYLAPAIEES
jgi:nicotinate-nucleotide adenylyltransferase